MRHNVKIFFMLSIAFCLYQADASATESAKEVVSVTPANSSFATLNWDEIRPSAMQIESLLADRPRGRAVVNSTTNDLWIVGEQHLWRWSLRDGSMSRLALPSGKNEALHLVYASNNYVYGIDGNGAWAFELPSKTWIRFDGRFDAKCRPKSVVPFKPGDDHNLFFMTDCGVFVLYFESKQLVAAGGSKLTSNPQDVLTLASSSIDGINSLMAIQSHEILRLSTNGSKIQKVLTYTAKSPLLGIVKAGAWYIAWARQAIIMFDKAMVRQQVIPVLGTRLITSFAATATMHAVGLADGSIELMDLNSQKKWSTAKNEFASQYLDFTDDGSLLILSLEAGVPRVFSMASVK